MKLAIHDRPDSYSDRWLAVCRDRGIPHVVVDCFDTDVMDKLAGVDGLLWHFHQEDPRTHIAAVPVVLAAEAAGVKVFPNSRTCWHFDDKISQKYLLEAVGAPMAPTWVFYDEASAQEWISRASFPKVFKLACGAGSQNVRLVHSQPEASNLVHRAFGKGFVASAGYFADLRRKLSNIRSTQVLLEKIKRAPRSMRNMRHVQRALPRQRGYIYFQEFMPDNDHDTRVTVIGDRAFGFTRGVRAGDFRASGSGRLNLDPASIDLRCVKIAFEVSRRIGAQSLAFDFVKDESGVPWVVEISYGYLDHVVHSCPGHWGPDLSWREGHTWPQDAILDDLLADLVRSTRQASKAVKG